MIILAMGVAGFIILLVGLLPVSSKRVIRGKHARLVGLILFLPLPLIFIIGWAMGGGVYPSTFDAERFQFRLEIIQLPLTLIALFLAFIVTYWPVDRQDRYRSQDALAELYPIREIETLTLAQAALHLKLPESRVKELIGDGTLRLIEGSRKSEIERGSFEAFLFCRQGVEYANNGRLEDALIEFDKAVGLSPQSARGYFLRGKANLRLENLNEAYSDFRQAQKLRPDFPQVARLLTQVEQISRSKSSAAKWRIGDNSNTLIANVIREPLFIWIALFVAIVAITTTMDAITALANYHCLKDYSCTPEESSATAIISRNFLGTRSVIGTATAAPMVAANNTLDALRTVTAAPTIRAYQTTIAIQTATAISVKATTIPFYATEAQSRIQLTTAANSPEGVDSGSGKLYIVGHGKLYVTNPSGKNFHALNVSDIIPQDHSDFDISNATVSPSGRQIAIIQAGDLYVGNTDGSGGFQVTQFRGENFAWSPDEKSVATTVLENGSTIYVLDVRDLNAPKKWRRLTNLASDEYTYGASWSMNGKSLVYCVRTGKEAGIYVLDIESGSSHRLIRTKGDCNVSWSPDGKHIAYTIQPVRDLFHDESFGQLQIMNMDGSNEKLLFVAPSVNSRLTQPSWSPDGQHIAFGTIMDEPTHSIFTINVDGSNLHNVSPNHSVDLFSPQVSWGP